MADSPVKATPGFLSRKGRFRLFGLTIDEVIKVFFGGNALVSVIVLALITIFLFKEGYGFFGQNLDNLRIYRQAGLEYVDYMRGEETDHSALTRYLSDLRLREFTYLTKQKGLSIADANTQLAAFDDFSNAFGDTVVPIRGYVSDLGDVAVAIKEKFNVGLDREEERKQLLAAGRVADAQKIVVAPIDYATELKPITGTLSAFKEENKTFATALLASLDKAPAMPLPELQKRLERFKELTRQYIAGFPEVERQMEQWDYRKPVPLWQSFTAFIFGKQWITASFWQDWYGVLPLLTGSLMVSFIAMFFAVPFGVGAAIYVNQISTPAEQKFIKPCIEFISAVPSVVLGFFGIAILGQTLRTLSQIEALSWIPGFPISERLNAFTAGCLLALLSVPTIFTLAEDALNNVPRNFKEASFALGANRLQTIIRIIVPAALSGIISAVLLGFGRVIGETMVVLLCAGNRIAIPDFSAGLGVVTQPVHTMTGIIAQEMGEVAHGSIHYRALFVLGLVLFLIALLINYVAQGIVRRYRISIG